MKNIKSGLKSPVQRTFTFFIIKNGESHFFRTLREVVIT